MYGAYEGFGKKAKFVGGCRRGKMVGYRRGLEKLCRICRSSCKLSCKNTNSYREAERRRKSGPPS